MPYRHFISFVVLFCAALSGAAQKTQYGFVAGPQYTTARYYLHGNKMETEGKFGGHVGAILKIPFEGRLHFTPSMYYTLKGFKVALTDTSSNPGVDAISNDLRVHSLEIAPLFTIYLGTEGSTRGFLQFGPAIDAAISGTENVGIDDGRFVKRNMLFKGNGYSRVTASLIIGAGFETTSGMFVRAQYIHGVGSLNNNDFGPSITQRVFGLSLGKFFDRK